MGKYIDVTCWGSRGSTSAPHRDRLVYGGNTSCFVIETERNILILDGGTGIVPFGEALVGRREGAKKEIHLFLSHLHLDHISGIPSFKPIYQPGYRVHIYGGRRTDEMLEEQLGTVFGPPYWPVRLCDCPAYKGSHGIASGEAVKLPEGISVRAIEANHPDGAVLYQISANGISIIYGLDCEMDAGMERKLAPFAEGADLLICDAQYSPDDYKAHQGWGHSAWTGWVKLAERCRVNRIWFSHFAWEYREEQLRKMDRDIKEVLPQALCVKEGLTIRLQGDCGHSINVGNSAREGNRGKISYFTGRRFRRDS